MAGIDDQDRHFTGQQLSSLPRHLIPEGTVSRLLNGRFIKGAITNGLFLEEMHVEFNLGRQKRVYASRVTYQDILRKGDVQLFAPLENVSGKFLIAVISGVLFQIDLKTDIAYDITPVDANLPISSARSHLSYIDNGGGVYGVGGYLVIFNYPQRPIFVNQFGARVSNPFAAEMPPSRLGATVGNRAGVISGDNILWMSDPVGGASSLAPLTFHEIMDASTGYTGQLFTIGSALDAKKVTAVGRLPKFLGPNQAFLAQNMIVSTKSSKYIVAAGAPRATWENGSIQFITYAGTTDGIAGPLALTNIGDNLIYMGTTGRIKAIAQDQQRETSMTETFMDDGLGQLMCRNEAAFHYRDWYSTLDHSRSVLKFFMDRLYATVYPMKVPAIGPLGQQQFTRSHRGLAIASLDPNTLLGSQAAPTWEGFYDWLNPVSITIVEDDMYILSKDVTGRIRYYRATHVSSDPHLTTIYTRGYFAGALSKSKSINKGSLYFRYFTGHIRVQISYLANEKWICAYRGEVKTKLHKFSFRENSGCRTNAQSIPLRIEIEHKGNRFELEAICVAGEAHAQE